jgi:DNA invertase Pin-like site-specific DNA recombinase
MCEKFISYRRVSTEKQGESGLGLDAQQAAVNAYLGSRPDSRLIADFIEVESGGRDDRPQLAAAMERARLAGATLVIAKLDRLSRDAAFLLGLAKSGVKFVAADMPHADALTVGILAVVAENERRLISERTKAALQAAKARGVKLGNPNGAAHLQGDVKARAVATLRAKAQSVADGLKATIEAIKTEGVTSANGIARALNARDIEGPRGGEWTARSVINVMARL